MNLIWSGIVWVVLPSLNFWYFMSYSSSIGLLSRAVCPPAQRSVQYIYNDAHCPKAAGSSSSGTGSTAPACATLVPEEPLLLSVDTATFDEYRARQLAPAMGEYHDTLLLQLPTRSAPSHDLARCSELHQHYASSSDNGNCFAVALTDHAASPTRGTIILRFDPAVDSEGHPILLAPDPYAPKKVVDKKLEAEAKSLGNASHNLHHLRPAGHFRRVPKVKGFARVVEKLQPFLRHLDGSQGMAAQLQQKLNSHNVTRGDDLVVMVVNEGEVDLYLNFACSCRLHNISLSNMLVFSGSPEVLGLIESTGAMGLYHEGYASVSKAASVDYLDRVFVDMMWYKVRVGVWGCMGCVGCVGCVGRGCWEGSVHVGNGPTSVHSQSPLPSILGCSGPRLDSSPKAHPTPLL